MIWFPSEWPLAVIRKTNVHISFSVIIVQDSGCIVWRDNHKYGCAIDCKYLLTNCLKIFIQLCLPMACLKKTT